MQTQAKALAKRPHVVVATPGRLRVSATIELLFPCFSKSKAFVSQLACLMTTILQIGGRHR